LKQPDRKWELVDGRLREKPGMTLGHNWTEMKLGYQLMAQLDWSEFQVRVDAGRVRRPGATFYIPDVFVLPVAATEPFRDRVDLLEIYDQPLPLVVEVWSPSTAEYDVTEKLADYRRRGDEEIWFLHPFERTLTAWRRKPDGTYEETVFRGGTVRPAALPGVAIDLDALFAA
jgi:Uma2 family endonuclease